MGFCLISPPNSYFLYSDSKLDDSYLFFDRHDERNTMVQSIMYFHKVPKLALPFWETNYTGISVINLFCPYFAINIIIDRGLPVSVWILCYKIIIQSNELNKLLLAFSTKFSMNF
jgi:hypothetical protein